MDLTRIYSVLFFSLSLNLFLFTVMYGAFLGHGFVIFINYKYNEKQNSPTSLGWPITVALCMLVWFKQDVAPELTQAVNCQSHKRMTIYSCMVSRGRFEWEVFGSQGPTGKGALMTGLVVATSWAQLLCFQALVLCSPSAILRPHRAAKPCSLPDQGP